MDILQETTSDKKTFVSHVFSTSEEGKSEILNVVQYAVLGIIPIIILNKIIQRFVPEADTDKSSLEIIVEILLQIIVMFCGIILIHRIISYIPTYSGFKYENLILTNSILAFLIIVLSIQTKLGIKVNVLVDRLSDLWNGPSYQNEEGKSQQKYQGGLRHVPSQADYVDNTGTQMDLFPPAPIVTSKPQSGGSYDMKMSKPNQAVSYEQPLMPANSLLGGAFGSSF
jgi:hypothetical protein